MTVLLDARSRRKNKERASSAEGNGGSSGILLSMDVVSTNSYAVYVQLYYLSWDGPFVIFPKSSYLILVSLPF